MDFFEKPLIRQDKFATYKNEDRNLPAELGAILGNSKSTSQNSQAYIGTNSSVACCGHAGNGAPVDLMKT